jgi:two-component system, OmpR family, sensor histidine kinase SenX3
MAVIDTGLGIPGSEQDQLFDRFFRGAQARERAIDGTGLGLHIAASIVSHHGGDVLADSTPGRGSTCTVRLPRRLRDGLDSDPRSINPR